DVAIIGDAKDALLQLKDVVNENSFPAWLEEFHICNDEEYNRVIHENMFPKSKNLSMGEAIKLISDRGQGKAVLVTDVGQHQMVASRYFKFNQSRSNVTSGGLGTMGFALPAALGAKMGAPNREVVAVIGDGGFQMTLQE